MILSNKDQLEYEEKYCNLARRRNDYILSRSNKKAKRMSEAISALYEEYSLKQTHEENYAHPN